MFVLNVRIAPVFYIQSVTYIEKFVTIFQIIPVQVETMRFI